MDSSARLSAVSRSASENSGENDVVEGESCGIGGRASMEFMKKLGGRENAENPKNELKNECAN